MAILKEPKLDLEKKQVQFTSLVDLLRANFSFLYYIRKSTILYDYNTLEK